MEKKKYHLTKEEKEELEKFKRENPALFEEIKKFIKTLGPVDKKILEAEAQVWERAKENLENGKTEKILDMVLKAYIEGEKNA